MNFQYSNGPSPKAGELVISETTPDVFQFRNAQAQRQLNYLRQANFGEFFPYDNGTAAFKEMMHSKPCRPFETDRQAAYQRELSEWVKTIAPDQLLAWIDGKKE